VLLIDCFSTAKHYTTSCVIFARQVQAIGEFLIHPLRIENRHFAPFSSFFLDVGNCPLEQILINCARIAQNGYWTPGTLENTPNPMCDLCRICLAKLPFEILAYTTGSAMHLANKQHPGTLPSPPKKVSHSNQPVFIGPLRLEVSTGQVFCRVQLCCGAASIRGNHA
jgi:hypothetical protein